MFHSSHENATYSQLLTWGTAWQSPEQVRFRLWAPAASSVWLETPEGERLPLQPTEVAGEAGWFETEAAFANGQHYRYRLSTTPNSAQTGEQFNDLAVPDPASRAQNGGPHGWSVLTQPSAYEWQWPHWHGRAWEEAVICEVHVGAMGGFAAVRRYLVDWAALGYTAIQLMPIGAFSGERNWGYDGVLPYALQENYGTPDELKALIDTAHGLGLQVFLDVVYNHFGPDGSFLHCYAPAFFRPDFSTPWGTAIDYAAPAVNAFFIDNAWYWLNEFRFDGLRFDAVHAFNDDHWLHNLALQIRAGLDPQRHIHLMLENEHNQAELIGDGLFNAQWNDDAHNALHVMLTGEVNGYYGAFASQAAEQLARCLSEGFAFQGEPSSNHAGQSRGTRSAHLPPTAFIFFLQNHDQIGNRALGDRLVQTTRPATLRAAKALQLLSPHIPLCFMGEEWGADTPFLFFTDYQDDLATAVREGRSREFADFAVQAGQAIPDPNLPSTFESSMSGWPDLDKPQHTEWLRFTRDVLAIRTHAVVPHLTGARAVYAHALGSHALTAQWRLGNGQLLTVWLNLADTAQALNSPDLPQTDVSKVLFETPQSSGHALINGELLPDSCVFLLQAMPATAAAAVMAESAELPLVTTPTLTLI